MARPLPCTPHLPPPSLPLPPQETLSLALGILSLEPVYLSGLGEVSHPPKGNGGSDGQGTNGSQGTGWGQRCEYLPM